MANATPHLLPRGERLLQGTIAELLSDSATEVEVNNPPSVDELPTYFEIDPSSDNPETIRVYDVSGNIIYFERGVYNSGVGREHLPNTPYKQKVTSQHWKHVVDSVEQGYLPEDPSITLTRNSDSEFVIEGVDRTDYYIDGRVVRFNGSDANTATIESSILSTGDTVITLRSGSGSVPSPLTKVEIAIQPRGYIHPLSNVTQMKNTLDGDSAFAVVSEHGIKAYVDAGWYTLGETMTYASADDPTYTATVAGVDLTGVLSPGMRMRVEQSTGGTKYFIVTAVAFSTDTTITLYGGTDYNLEDEEISNPKFSTVKAPQGFPLDSSKWSVVAINSSDGTQATPNQNTWYNLGGSIVAPIGKWNYSYKVAVFRVRAAAGNAAHQSTLSTANNSQSDATTTVWVVQDATPSGAWGVTHFNQGVISLESKTTLYLNVSKTTSGVYDSILCQNSSLNSVIKLTSSYL